MTKPKDREDHIQAREKSGLSKTAYAKLHGIKRNTFYRWFREQRNMEHASDGFIYRNHDGWLQKKDADFENEVGIELKLPKGYLLTVPKGFDRETLTAVIDLLEAR